MRIRFFDHGDISRELGELETEFIPYKGVGCILDGIGYTVMHVTKVGDDYQASVEAADVMDVSELKGKTESELLEIIRAGQTED